MLVVSYHKSCNFVVAEFMITHKITDITKKNLVLSWNCTT
jgi:hypothetical protein